MLETSVQRVRVLHCAETIKGGVASYLRDLLALQARDFGVASIVVVVPKSQLDQLVVPDGLTVIPFDDHQRRWLSALKLLFCVVHAWLRYKPEVFHLHSTFAGAIVRAVLGLVGLRRRLIYCPHGWAWDRDSSALPRFFITKIERILSHFCARIICISRHEKDAAMLVGIDEKKLRVVLNGVSKDLPPSPQSLPEWPGAAKRLLFVGRFDKQKGVDVFCEALILLGDDACGLLAGGAVLNDGVALNIPPNARSVGWVDPSALQGLFETADVLVVPSRWEGFGLIAAEGMRAGLPVIASNVGGLAEVVIDGETGVLVTPGDPAQLARAVMNSERLWPEMGRKGRARVESHFTFERVHMQITQIYESLGSGRVVASFH